MTKQTTVQTAQMRLPASNPPAAPGPSSATTQCVCPAYGAAMETRTVQTGRTSGRRTVWDSTQRSQPCTVAFTSSSVLMGIVSAAAGGVTEEMTARIDQTRSTAVSAFFTLPLCKSVSSDKSSLISFN